MLHTLVVDQCEVTDLRGTREGISRRQQSRGEYESYRITYPSFALHNSFSPEQLKRIP